MSQIILHESPSLTRPILIAAFAGWNDAGRSATIAVQHLISTWSASQFGEIDPDPFFDFTASRPWIKLDEDGQSQVTWPRNHFYAHHDPHGGLDAILLLGTEPGLHWRVFTREIVDLARSLNVSMAVTLGSYLAPVSHKDPVPISGWAWPTALHDRLKEVQISPVQYEGPTGIVSVLGAALADARIPVASLWAALPGFLGPTANPKGALALVKCLDRAFDLNLKLDELARVSEQFEKNVNQAVKRVHAMPGIALFEAQSENQAGASDRTESLPSSDDAGELPTADEIIRAAEEFLRQNGKH